MKARKLKSGSWNAQAYLGKDEDGKNILVSVTRQTKAEAEYDARQIEKKYSKNPEARTMTVRDAVKKYIALSPMLSPTTLYRYQQMCDTAFPSLMELPVIELSDLIVQQAINEEAARISERTHKPLSSKTVSNEYGLISSALKTVCNLTFNIRLPKKQPKRIDLPSAKTIFEIIKGTNIELPCLLAMWLSFSMSEIKGIQCSSIHDGLISIDQVMVTVGRVPVVKDDAKVSTRKRTHEIPPYIMQLINNTETYQKWLKSAENGFLIDLTADTLYSRFKRLMARNGYDMTFHQLRHVSASVMALLNIPDKYAQERGGWKTDHIMKSVYQHTFSEERQAVDAKIDSYFNDIIGNI